MACSGNIQTSRQRNRRAGIDDLMRTGELRQRQVQQTGLMAVNQAAVL